MKFDYSFWPVAPIQPHFGGKVAFLIDGRAISAAETYMGMVEHYKLGAIVGGPTAGTNGNVNPFTLPGGYSFSWTGMKVLKHDGSQHHGVGIQPTVPVQRTIRGVAEGRDEILEAAIKLVGQ
jgi:C-terminal processing protease CtpA/Prc